MNPADPARVASLSCCPPGAGIRELVAVADSRLYEAKRRGRNRTVGANEVKE